MFGSKERAILLAAVLGVSGCGGAGSSGVTQKPVSPTLLPFSTTTAFAEFSITGFSEVYAQLERAKVLVDIDWVKGG